jgi:hypothetical protein
LSSKRVYSFDVRLFATSLCLILGALLVTAVDAGGSAGPNSSRWFKKVLPQFTAPGVPELGPAEAVAPVRAKEWPSIRCSTWAKATTR